MEIICFFSTLCPQLGLGDSSDRDLPVQVAITDADYVSSIACGWWHTLAVVYSKWEVLCPWFFPASSTLPVRCTKFDPIYPLRCTELVMFPVFPLRYSELRLFSWPSSCQQEESQIVVVLCDIQAGNSKYLGIIIPMDWMLVWTVLEAVKLWCKHFWCCVSSVKFWQGHLVVKFYQTKSKLCLCSTCQLHGCRLDLWTIHSNAFRETCCNFILIWVCCV